MVAADEDIAGYVQQLEARNETDAPIGPLEDIPSGDALAAELEQFLREQDGQS